MAEFAPLIVAALALALTPIGGVAYQVTASALSYAGMCVASLFDSDVREDMDSIGWNPFNSNEEAVLNSKYVSFYKGVPVFRTNLGRSGTFLAIFLARGETSTDTVRHEFGHIPQQLLLGPIRFGLYRYSFRSRMGALGSYWTSNRLF
jgi:hypothetical protein